ncbi:MAG TPA: fused MFS/spermidine synthase, partial [Blastocatellia bacterium]|nr:fused MFS/spermidine synthase [Blastocatellia bacterium]
GVSGLIYQVIWVRQLELVFGTTTFAASTVLTAFMGGLALGSYYFGRQSERQVNNLRLYGFIELGIGIYGVLVPHIFTALPKLYEPFWLRLHLSFLMLTVIRFVLAALVLIVPTALMGATLPVLANYYVDERRNIGLKVGSLYSINTFGAVLGAISGGFILIPALGMLRSSYTAAGINLTLGIVALGISRITDKPKSSYAVQGSGESSGQTEHAVHEQVHSGVENEGAEPATSMTAAGSGKTYKAGEADAERRRLAGIIVLAGFAISGFVALSYEVIWSRVLALIIGSSVYAFSIMLATFLIGLAVGSTASARIVDRLRRPVFAFAGIELLIGLASLGGAYLFNELPYAFIGLYRWLASSSVSVLLLARFAVASLVMIVPTLLLGTLFPLVVRIIHGQRGEASNLETLRPSRTVGDVYAVNTLGSIGGAFASGFLLIPGLGILTSLRFAIGLNFVVAAVVFAVCTRLSKAAAETAKQSGKKKRKKQRRKPMTALVWLPAAAAVLLVVWTGVVKPPWDIAIMSSAVYRYAPQVIQMDHQQFFDYFSERGQGDTIFYKEGVTATVVVQRQSGGRVLKVNGKPDASTAGDLPTQVLIGDLPLLVREQADDCLVIGLGSGVTLGSVEQFPVKHVTCVELEPAVIQASHCFDDLNNKPLDDPRLTLVVNDGRNFIGTTRQKYDVIVSEPSNPWLTGAASLFTLEYFQQGAQRLKDGGVFSQWLQIYEMAPQDVQSMIATFRAVFPGVYLFRGAEGDLMLLGAKSPMKLDLDLIRSRLTDPKVAADLRRVQVKTPADIVSRLYMGGNELARYTAGSDLNTDDNALIEFSAPRRVGISGDTVTANVKQLLAYSGSPLPYLDGDTSSDPPPVAGDPFKIPDPPQDDAGPPGLLLDSALSAIERDDVGRAEQLTKYSLDMKETARGHSIEGEILSARGEDDASLNEWRTALAMNPDHFYTLLDMGKYYLKKNEAPNAASYLDHALKIDSTSARAHHLRGLAYQEAGDSANAAEEYRQALPDAKYTRSIPSFYLNYGMALFTTGVYDESAEMLEEYIKLMPSDYYGHYQLGAAYEVMAERSIKDNYTDRAIAELKKALTTKPDYAMAHYYLSKAYRRLGLDSESDGEYELYERFLPK